MSQTRVIKQIAILGSSGMLGYALSTYYSRQGYIVISIDRMTFDASKDSVEILKDQLAGCDFVVNCIGIIKPRIDKVSPELALLVNGIFPKNLAKLTNKMKIHCFHVTTDCVFSGKKGHYSEDDYYDIVDLYGLSKNAGENADCMTLRTSIIGEEPNNKYSLLEWARSQKGKEVPGFTNHIWNGVTTIYLAELIETIHLDGLYQKGVFHIHSPGTVTKYELLSIMNDVYRLDLSIKKISAPENIDRSLTSNFPYAKKYVTKNVNDQIKEMHDFFCTYK